MTIYEDINLLIKRLEKEKEGMEYPERHWINCALDGLRVLENNLLPGSQLTFRPPLNARVNSK